MMPSDILIGGLHDGVAGVVSGLGELLILQRRPLSGNSRRVCKVAYECGGLISVVIDLKTFTQSTWVMSWGSPR